MTDLTLKIKTELLRFGADIVGFGDLGELPHDGAGARQAGLWGRCYYLRQMY